MRACVQRYETHGKADFGQFVKAFEEYFSERTRAVPAVATGSAAAPEFWGGGGVARDNMLMRDEHGDMVAPVRPDTAYRATADQATFTQGHTSGGTYFSTHINPQNRGHGDILGWSTPTTSGEHTDKGRRIPSRTLYDTYSMGAHQLTGEDRARFLRGDILGFSTAGREYRGPRPHKTENRGSGNITAWAGGASVAGEGGEGDTDSVARPGGRARVHTPLADKARSRAAPFACDE